MEMIIDSHCHIDFKDFDDDREQVLERAKDIGIKHIILPRHFIKKLATTKKPLPAIQTNTSSIRITPLLSK